MAQQFLTGGDGSTGQTGLESRNIINENFTEVYTQGILENTSGALYLKGDETTDDSLRFIENGDNADAVFQRRTDGVWAPAGLELGTETVSFGPRVGLGAFGSYIATTDAEADADARQTHPFALFDGQTSTSAQRAVDAYTYVANDPIQNDFSGSITGTEISFVTVETENRLSRATVLKTGSTAASDDVNLKIYAGTTASDPLIFNQTYPASTFPANADITLTSDGWLQTNEGDSYFTVFSSAANFSLLADVTNTVPYLLSNNSLFRIDDLWQLRSYESRADGVYSFTAGEDYAVQNKLPYVCNTTGTQTGTFASNIALWDLLGSGSGDVTGPASSIDDHVVTFDGTTGKAIQNNGVGILRSPNSVSLAELILQDSTGSNKLLIQHSDSLDINTINSTENLTVETTGTGAQLTLEASDGDVVVRAFSDDRVEFSSGVSNAGAGFQFAQTGTSGSTARLAVISTSPEGNTTASPGSLALSTTGSAFIKETGIGNTGWVELGEGDGDITMSNTPIDNAMITADGTSGNTVQAFNFITADVIAGVQNRLSIVSGSTSGGLFLFDSSEVSKGSYFFNDSTDQIAFTSESGIDINIAASADVLVTAGDDLSMTGDTVTLEADGGATTGRMFFVTNEIQTLQSGWLFRNEVASGADVGLSVQSNAPNGSNNGTPGDIIFRSDLLNSDIYVKQTAADTTSTSGWRGVFATIDAITEQNTAFAAINRTTATSVTQTISSSQTDWYPFTGFDNNVESTTSFLTADQANNRVDVEAVTDTTNGDLYEVSLTVSASAQSNTDINYRVAVYDNNSAINTTENLLLREIHNDGSNFINAINLSGVIRGPTGATNSYFRPEFQRTTGSTNYFHLTSAIYFSVRRIA